MRPDDPVEELHADARAHFMSTVSFVHDIGDDRAWGHATMDPYLRSGFRWPGVAALLTFSDVLIGRLASHRTAPRISVTADLGVEVIAPPAEDGLVRMEARILKSGRTMSVGETEFRDSTGRLIGTSTGTFLASPRPGDELPGGFPRPATAAPTGRVAPTLAAQVGLRLVGPGVAEIALRPDLVNATDSLQGGLVALLGEVAATSAATAADAGADTGGRHVAEALHVHYLAAARVGPFRTAARVQAVRPGAALVRVEIRDRGREDRLVAVVTARTQPEPATTDPSGHESDRRTDARR